MRKDRNELKSHHTQNMIFLAGLYPPVLSGPLDTVVTVKATKIDYTVSLNRATGMLKVTGKTYPNEVFIPLNDAEVKNLLRQIL